MKLALGIIIVIIVSLFATANFNQAFAHGSGPPFLKINGKYAQSNPSLTVQDKKLNVAQDLPPEEKYLVNVPINFEIDMQNLQIAGELKPLVEFRWTWDEGIAEYSSGTKLSHTYKKIGSHQLIMEMKLPQENTYTLINSVKLDVVPNLKYKLPIARIGVFNFGIDARKPVTFRSNAETDPSAKVVSYLWKLDENIYKTEESPTYQYKETGSLIKSTVLRITDSNGFVGYAIVTLSGEVKDVAIYDPTDPNASTISLKSRIITLVTFFGSPLVIGLVVALDIIYIMRKRRKKKNNDI